MEEQCIYLDDQGGRQMQVLKEDVSPCILLNGAKAHALIVCEKKLSVVAFAQNTREEVRVIGEDGNVAGALSAESGTHQTTYLCVKKRKNVLRGTKDASKLSEEVMCFDSKTGLESYIEKTPTILATTYKEPPIIIKRR